MAHAVFENGHSQFRCVCYSPRTLNVTMSATNSASGLWDLYARALLIGKEGSMFTFCRQVLNGYHTLALIHRLSSSCVCVLAGSAFQRFVSDFGKLGAVITMCSRNNGRSKHQVSIVLEWPSC